MVTVDQLMAKSLINIDAGRSVIEAAKLMKTHKVGSVLVKKENRTSALSLNQTSFAE